MRIRPHALVLGTLLVPLNCVWLAQMEMATQYAAGYGGGPYPTTFSMFANVIVVLLFMRGVNAVLARLQPRWALNMGEMLVIYTMLCIASSVDAIDMIDVLVPMITHVYRYDDAAAGRPYADDIIAFTPKWFTLNDPAALKAWHEGRPEAFWRPETLTAWLPPIALWTGFLLVMLGVMLCMTLLLRRKWIGEERLGYPITYIPVQIAQSGRGLFGNGVFWLGFSVAAGLSLLNGLAVLVPWLPTIRVKMTDLSGYFVGRPWNAVGWTPVSFYPFAIGLGYLLPPDLLFSCWFSHWFLKAERVVASATGLLGYDARAPYVEEQCFGAYIYVALFGLWLGRKYFARVLTAGNGVLTPRPPLPRSLAAREPSGEGEQGDDRTARLALVGTVVGMLALGAFFALCGMSTWLVVLAWGIYWLVSLAVTRMRAELGPPAHDLHQGGPDYLLPVFLGTRVFGKRNLNMLTWFYWYNRAYRSHPMPHMLEGFFMARRNHYDEKPVLLGIVVAAVLGTVTTFIALIYFGYHNGAEAKMAGHATWFGFEAFGRLRGWIASGTPWNPPAIGGALAGLSLAAVLHKLTIQYIWWPLHPLGFAIAGSYSMTTMWCPMLIAWVTKTAILRYGGQRTYMRLVPFFVGLLVGDYLPGCLWPVLGWILGKPMYSFQQ